MQVRIKRVYEKPAPTDGLRVLVDRLWPRGLTKKDAAIDVWAKELAPSDELRRWFAHKDERFAEFTRRYELELIGLATEVDRLLSSIGDRAVTLLYAAKNTTSNHAIVLKSHLQNQMGTPRSINQPTQRKPNNDNNIHSIWTLRREKRLDHRRIRRYRPRDR